MRAEKIEDHVAEKLPQLIRELDEKGVEQFFTENDNFLKSFAINESDINELIHQVEHYVNHKEYEKALDILIFLTILNPTESSYFIKSGIVLYKMEKYTESINMFEGALFFDVQNPAPWLFMSNCYLQLNDKSKAREALENCVEAGQLSLDPEAADYVRLAQNSLKMGVC